MCSQEHKWLVYNTVNGVFTWEKAGNIINTKHKLVRSRLGDLVGCESFEVHLNKDDDSDVYQYILATPSESVKSSASHTFIVLDVDVGKTEEVPCSQLDPSKHLLMLFSTKKSNSKMTLRNKYIYTLRRVI